MIADLPNILNEASGIEIAHNSNIIWMLNDGGNPSELYGLNLKGSVLKVLKINAKIMIGKI